MPSVDDENDLPVPVSVRLRALRRRAGLSLAQMAQALGLSGPSSYRRYEDPTVFTKQSIPSEKIFILASTLTGKGTPPIRMEEVWQLAGWDFFGISLELFLENNSKSETAPIVRSILKEVINIVEHVAFEKNVSIEALKCLEFSFVIHDAIGVSGLTNVKKNKDRRFLAIAMANSLIAGHTSDLGD